MPLRIRIFLWVSLLFFVTIVTIFVTSELEIRRQLNVAEKDITAEIDEFEKQNRKDILTFLSLEVNNIEQKIFSTFNHIHQVGTLTERYIPSSFNMQTKNWASLGILLTTHHWMDFSQVVIEDQLTAGFVLKSPFLRRMVRIPYSEKISLFATETSDGFYEVFIGVPFWSNRQLLEEGFIPKKQTPFIHYTHDQWLLFKPDQIEKQDPKDLVHKNLNLDFYLFDPSVNLHSTKEVELLTDTTIKMVNRLKQYYIEDTSLQALLKDKTRLDAYIAKEFVDPAEPDNFIRENCNTEICQALRKRVQKDGWGSLRYWGNRNQSINLIWELAMVTGCGLWDFNPYDALAPVGIAAFPWNEDANAKNKRSELGEGLLVQDAFLVEPLKEKRFCKFEEDFSKVQSCANNELTFITKEEFGGIYLAGSMFFEVQQPPKKAPIKSMLTLGVSVEDTLHELALASPNDVLLVSNQGIIRLYTTEGKVDDLTNNFNLNPQKLIEQKTGTIANIDGEEFFFVHLTSLTEDNGHVLIIIQKEGERKLLARLSDHTKGILHHISIESAALAVIALLVTIFILNHVISRITRPFAKLAAETKKIGAGNFSEVSLPKSLTDRNDEIGAFSRAFFQMTYELKEGEKVRGILDKVVSKEVAEKVLSDGVELGGEMRDITIMFADVRNFTRITEKMHPEDVLAMLNDCLTVLSRVIDDFGGVIDKYEGDDVMALFGAPVESDNHALQATLCGLEMIKVLREWNDQRERNGLIRLEIGIGIHSGACVVGNIGAENRLSYTCLGHAVNLASRITDEAGPGQILVTESLLAQPFVSDNISSEPLAPKSLKGLSEPIVLYEVKPKLS